MKQISNSNILDSKFGLQSYSRLSYIHSLNLWGAELFSLNKMLTPHPPIVGNEELIPTDGVNSYPIHIRSELWVTCLTERKKNCILNFIRRKNWKETINPEISNCSNQFWSWNEEIKLHDIHTLGGIIEFHSHWLHKGTLIIHLITLNQWGICIFTASRFLLSVLCYESWLLHICTWVCVNHMQPDRSLQVVSPS